MKVVHVIDLKDGTDRVRIEWGAGMHLTLSRTRWKNWEKDWKEAGWAVHYLSISNIDSRDW